MHKADSMCKPVSRRFVFLWTLCWGMVGSTLAWAQTPTADLRGTVSAEDGARVEGAQVLLLHLPSGNTFSTDTNSAGAFAFMGQRAGGPYLLTVTKEHYLERTIENIQLNVGKREVINVLLPQEMQEVVITAKTLESQTSGKTVVGEGEIAALPSISRDPKDLVRLNPNAYIDNSTSGLSIGGSNNRFNSITVDGIRQDDDFGLNLGGYPTQRSPISLNTIEQLAVETSPYDVSYGGFLGGNVNVVTKSGGNDFHGSAQVNYSDDNLTGDKSDNDTLKSDFMEVSYGATLSGPILRDKLHFFLSFDGLNARTPVTVGLQGSGQPNEVKAITQADLDRIQEISERVYDFDAGDPSKPLDELDLKLFSKLDWKIANDHRATVTYQFVTGNVVQRNGSSDTRLRLTSNWYNKDETLHAYTARLYSGWTDSFTSEIEFSGKNVATEQVPLNGREFMHARIATSNPDPANPEQTLKGDVQLGPDEYRHANQLTNDLINVKAKANYLLWNHLLTGGWEFSRVDIYNLFVPRSHGYVDYASIDDFENKIVKSISYQNAITNNPDDAASNWAYNINSYYVKDEIEILKNLSGQIGVRYELYSTGDRIPWNGTFNERYGFSNTARLDGRDIWMPRAGLSFRPIPGLNLRAGSGLFSGGTPNVWVSNAYTNNGMLIDRVNSSDHAVIDGFDGRHIPEALQQGLTAGKGNVDALDRDFDLPASWKSGVGLDYDFALPVVGNGFELTLDFLYTQVKSAPLWKDLRRDSDAFSTGTFNNRPVGTLPDGRPYYDTTFNPSRGYDLLLTDTDQGYGYTVSGSLSKTWKAGLAVSLGYAHQTMRELLPAAGSTSATSYAQVAAIDPNNPRLARSNYERTHRVIGVVSYTRPLFADLLRALGKTPKLTRQMNTTLSMVFESRSGQPYSYTFGGTDSTLAQVFGEANDFARYRRMLFYVPRGDGSDVDFAEGFDEAAFNSFLEKKGLAKYRGRIAPRNAFEGPWVHQVDLRIKQELPNPFAGHRAMFFFDIENVGNLLTREWGRDEGVPFPFLVPVVDVNVDRASGKYIYTNLNTARPTQVNPLSSVWRIQLSLAYEF